MRMKQKTPDDMVLIAEIGAPNGVRGDVRVKVFGDNPAALTAYGPLQDAAGKIFKVLKSRPAKTVHICQIEGIADRTQAESLTRTRLYVPRESFPETDEDEFYYVDLVGLEVRLDDGSDLGTVNAVQDFGAGDIIEIRSPDDTLVMIPFSKAAVPEVRVKDGYIVVANLPGLFGNEEKPEEADGE